LRLFGCKSCKIFRAGEERVAAKIFVNYRRGDDPRSVSALYMRLEEEFGRDNVLMDVASYVEPGDGFIRGLAGQVAQCGVLLAVIGPNWAEKLAARTGDPEDFVPIEIAAAFHLGKPAIPILVGGATLPRAEALPEYIRGLVRRGAVSLRPDEFQADCDSLIRALRKALGAGQGEPPRPQAARQEERPVQTAQGTWEPASTPEDARKAEELANWDFIKDSPDPDEFRNHIARYGNGPTGGHAYYRLEALVWADPATHAGIESLWKFIQEFPRSEHVQAAQAELARLETAADGENLAAESRREETRAWSKVAAGSKIRELEEFLGAWPNGVYAGPAERRIRELREQGASKGGGLMLLIMLGIVALMAGLVALATVKF
jgi:hypothetical protein